MARTIRRDAVDRAKRLDRQFRRNRAARRDITPGQELLTDEDFDW